MDYIKEAIRRHGLKGESLSDVPEEKWDSIIAMADDMEGEDKFQQEDHYAIHRSTLHLGV